MKIALVYHQFIRRGGLEGYLLEFAARLRDAGHELALVASRIDEPAKALAARVEVIPPALTSGGTLAKFAASSAELAPRLRAEGWTTLGFGRTWRQDAHRAGGGCHRVYSDMLPWWKRLKPKNRLELALERRLYTGGETRLFVVNSGKVRDELADVYAVPPERARVIHTAVETARWKPAERAEEREKIRRERGAEQGRPVLMFASLDHRRKGLDVLLEALTASPDALLWVAGKPLEPWRGTLKRLGLEKRVVALGDTDLLPCFQAADWFVHPTRYDACANTVLQSMACGLPGIISAADGAAEFIRHGENGLLLRDPRDPAELADHLKTALSAPAAGRSALSSAARETVLPLTWEAHVGKWMEAIAETRG